MQIAAGRILVLVEMCLRCVRLVVPPAAIVQLHPVVISILDLAGALEGLGQEISKVVIVGGVLEPEVAHITQVLVEFF